MKLEFSGQIFEKNIKILNFMKILPMGAEVFSADIQTHRHEEANGRFSQCCRRA